MSQMLEGALLLAFVFSPLAGLMAFLITYQEYRHHYPDWRPAFRAGLEVGLVTVAFFLLLSGAAGLLLWIFVR